MNIDDIIEKLNIFSNILLEKELIKECVNIVENQDYQEGLNFKWVSNDRSFYLNEQSLILCTEEWGGMLGNRRMRDLRPIDNLVQYFDAIYGAEFNFEDPSFFLNECFVNQNGIEKYLELQELIRVKLNEEMVRFLEPYPDLLSLFWAIKNKDIAVLEQAESIKTVELLGEAVPGYYQKICQDIKEGLSVDSAAMTSYILQYAMISRYFPQTGRIVWWSNEYNEANSLRQKELSQQKYHLSLESKENYLKKLEKCFLENVIVLQFQNEIFPNCSQSMYEQSIQELFRESSK